MVVTAAPSLSPAPPWIVIAEGCRDPQVAVDERPVVAQVDPVEVGAELLDDRARLTVGGACCAEVVVAPEREDAQRVSIADPPSQARLVVPVSELHGGRDGADDRARVPVASGDEGAPTTIAERRLEQSSRVDESHVGFTVRRRGRVARPTRRSPRLRSLRRRPEQPPDRSRRDR